ncbi:hypothetical protein [Acidianus brierleyi]|uniref:Uncharacterized protein n=1 Tax=Acidianus brierleyi TaxID=41673 RepID=A0A2U9IBX8_9CREN|nr:hypothetical protein [Acidianus brierleyi]AWR93517.1 hypothetical protein DFR85_01705 [Acidianus brierleyi]
MNYDERTTAEAIIEIYFNLYAFRESISNYQITYENDWSILKGKEGSYISKEFDTYAILIYPTNAPDDLLNAFSNKISKIDKFREILYKPKYWREYITLHLNGNKIFTGNDLNLFPFNGEDIVNDLLNSEGIEFITLDDELRIATHLERPINSDTLSRALNKLLVSLSLYYRIKEAQEDIALKLTKEILDSIRNS